MESGPPGASAGGIVGGAYDFRRLNRYRIKTTFPRAARETAATRATFPGPARGPAGASYAGQLVAGRPPGFEREVVAPSSLVTVTFQLPQLPSNVWVGSWTVDTPVPSPKFQRYTYGPLPLVTTA